MRIRLTRKPGQPGTIHELQIYGDKLICVRYRYDKATHKRHKTVELIIETIDWCPAPAPDLIPPETLVYLRVAMQELEIRQKLKTVRAVWHAQYKLWRLRYDAALALSLEDRIDWDASQPSHTAP